MLGVDRVLLVPGYCYSQFRDDGRGYCYSQFRDDERELRHSGTASSSNFRHSGAANSRTRNPGVFLTYLIKSLLLILITTPLLANYQTGLDAYLSGSYSKALLEWKTATTLEDTGSTHAETQYAIGMLYWLGQGVTKDYFEASKWMHKAGSQGHAGAQGKLGYLYSQGIAVKEDKTQAFNWFSKAAKQGDVDGQYNLGIFYLNGWGTAQNKTMAAQYLAAAAAQGDESAEYEVQKLVDQIAHNKTQATPKTKSEIPDQVRHDNNLSEGGTTQTTPGRQAQTSPGRQAQTSSGRQAQTSPSRQAQTSPGRHPGLDPGSSLLTPEETPKTKSEIPDQVRHDNNLSEGGTTQTSPGRQAQTSPGRQAQTSSGRQAQISSGRHPGLDPGSSLLTPEETPKTKSEIPDQVRHDESSIFLTSTWIQQQNPDHYTIQVIGLSSKADLENLLSGHQNLTPLASFTLQRNGKPLYMLIQGSYPDVDSARYARDNFPTSIQKRKQLWIRQFTKIQELIKAETGGQSE